ncbi:hypothetical protein IC607_16980 [Cellulomonas sp. JH27-2]|uniref:DUF6716 putative glycosyltransferase n=1 Tax=Cellulomonas sp. JH27-2 TaxID=2774139 RepID=UPI00177B49AE|nr:DUF6716 putative glycosyltransferase [Cellulomonas sp. JH27-2]MBD8060665.1 hypothetical protein [Cellulomonas sp. JH27-2]
MTRSVLAVADSDSYVKWAAATLDSLPDVRPHLVVLRTRVRPDDAQTTSALAGTRWAGSVLDDHSLLGLAARLRRTRPDVILVASTGPAAELVIRLVATLPYRPVVVTGLPGMSIPATPRALRFRAGADVFVVHSHRERLAFEDMATDTGVRPAFAVNRLPFLRGSAGEHAAFDDAPVRRVVFAPQAKFPETPEQRRAVLQALAALARARPDVEVVVKLRARPGQAQTHDEAYPFDILWDELGSDAPVRLVTGPLADQLAAGTALVSVSSTALLEALGHGLRALVLSDFGVGDANLTGVYEGSGLVGTLRDVEQARFFHPDRAWLADNYFHVEPDELAAVLAEVDVSGPVRPGPPVGGRRAQARRYARTALPLPRPFPSVRVFGRHGDRRLGRTGEVSRGAGS